MVLNDAGPGAGGSSGGGFFGGVLLCLLRRDVFLGCRQSIEKGSIV